MCGIAGVVNFEGYDLEALKRSIAHRGPDEQSLYTDQNLALIHTRLSIQDIAHGHQPFHFGDFSIIFNGEIYNHLELRSRLSHFTFQTHSDTETLLYLFIQYGEAMFDLLDGMFALCIYDKKNQTLFLARDRSGKKPLYFMQEGKTFIFASELNAMKAVKKLEINKDAISCYLRAGFIYQSYTPYEKVFELGAATCMKVDLETGKTSSKKYYDILGAYYSNRPLLSLSSAMEEVEEKLKISVRDRLTASDVEVGAFLSGGIDSNLIVAMAAKIKPNLKTFTVKFTGSYDESVLAKIAAEKYQTDHSEIEISMNLNQDIDTILTNYGEPFVDSSAIPSYYVARAAKERVKVVLNGDGADELFGGYRRYVPIANNLMRYMKYFSKVKTILPKPRNKQAIYSHLHRLLCMSDKQGLDFYLSATSDVFEDVYEIKNNSILNEMHAFVLKTQCDKKLSSLSKMLYLDFNLLLFSDLLVKMDIATMANALEARSPFLSKYMLELAPSLPDSLKINKWQTKSVLRNLAKKYLPQELIHQPKRGFEVPLKKWVEQDLKNRIYDHLSPGCYAENYMDRKVIDSLLKNTGHFSSEKRAKMLWSLFCLETWYKNEK